MYRRASARLLRSYGRRLSSSTPRPVIVVHGGAWAIPEPLTDASVAGCEAAAQAGWEVLQRGGSALDAVEAATRVLEDDPAFDAGNGAVLNEVGEVELDAIVMDGVDLSCGAVAAIGPVANPVSVARMVMERTPHCLLVGEGATRFAEQQGVPLLRSVDLVTAEAQQQWREMAAFPTSVKQLFNTHPLAASDTVGAVALDASGNLASATSTGGITFKRVGRVGDSPIVGAGCYADNDLGAVSCTGHGESIMRLTLARHALWLMHGRSPGEACAEALRQMHARVGGCGGTISIAPSGEVGVAFSTPRMAWACVRGDGDARSGIDRSASLAEAEEEGGEGESIVEVVRLDRA